MEYLHHFQLSEDPFRNDHRERFVAELPSQRHALARVDRGVRQGRGLVTLTGPAGCGKSAVARHLYEELEEEVFESSMMVVLRSHADSDWLLHRFAASLGVEEPAPQREGLVGQIYERLAIVQEDGRHAVLIIDDAQALATVDTLGELCALVKLEYEDRRMLTVVLVGSTALTTTLRAHPELAHHVEVGVPMPGFDEEEAAEYLAGRIRVAGGDPQILMPGAVAALVELGGGAPGRMNILADNALFEAYAAGRPQVARSDVERAYTSLGWDDLGTAALPAPDSAAMAEAPARDFAPGPTLDLGDSLSGLVASTPAPAAPMEEPQAVLEHTPLPEIRETMDFDAAPAIPAPEAAAPALAPTEIELEPSAALPTEGPPKDDEEDAVDALFMDLIED